MENLILSPEQETDIKSLNPIVQRMWDIVITDDTVQEAGELIRNANEGIKRIDEMRLAKTRPLDALKKEWMNFFEGMKAKPEKALFSLKAKMNKYLAEQKEKQAKAEQEAYERQKQEAEKLSKQADFLDKMGDLNSAVSTRMDADKVLQEQPKIDEPTKIKGIHTRRVYKYRIIDANLIPDEFFMVDEAKLSELARSSKATAQVAGVEFYTEEVVAVVKF